MEDRSNTANTAIIASPVGTINRLDWLSFAANAVRSNRRLLVLATQFP
jgi:hypothetical protein